MTSDGNTRTGQTVLVGISNPETAARLVRLAKGITGSTGTEILLTHVVTVAHQISLGTGRSSPEVVRARDFLQRVIGAARSEGIAARGLVEVARSVEDGLLAAADSHAVGTILVGYSDHAGETGSSPREEGRFDRTMHRVARKAHADVVVAKFRRDVHESIAVPVSADARLELTAALCASLAEEIEAEPTFLHVIGPDASLEDARQDLSARLDDAGLLERGRLELLTADSPTDAIVAAVADYDLVILTPSDRPGLLHRMYSSQAEKIAEAVSASVILAWERQADR